MVKRTSKRYDEKCNDFSTHDNQRKRYFFDIVSWGEDGSVTFTIVCKRCKAVRAIHGAKLFDGKLLTLKLGECKCIATTEEAQNGN